MRIGPVEIRWIRRYPPYVVNVGEEKDLSGAFTIPDTDLTWRAVHQTLNELEQETVEGARRYVANTNQCISAIGAGEGVSLVRQRLIEKRNNAISESKKLRRAG